MIAITTNSSIRVKPARRARFGTSRDIVGSFETGTAGKARTPKGKNAETKTPRQNVEAKALKRRLRNY
jgi:hypothetical protein